MAVMEGLHLTSLLAGALVAGLPPVLLVLNRASTWDWLRGYLDYPPGFGPESVTPYALSDVNVVTVPLP